MHVSAPITFQLGKPEVKVRLRQPLAQLARMSVPIAPVNEDYFFPTRKDKIWCAR